MAHGGHHGDADGLMDEQDDLRVVLEAEMGLDKASCSGICDDGRVAQDATCSKTTGITNLTTPFGF